MKWRVYLYNLFKVKEKVVKAEIVALNQKYMEVLALLKSRLDWENALLRLEELDSLTQDANLWNNPEEAQKLVSERTRLSDQIAGIIF